MELKAKANSEQHSTWNPVTSGSKLAKKYKSPPLGSIDLSAELSAHQTTVEISANLQHTWQLIAPIIIEPFTVRRGEFDIASIAMEFKETKEPRGKFECIVKATRSSSENGFVDEIILSAPGRVPFNQLIYLAAHKNTQTFSQSAFFESIESLRACRDHEDRNIIIYSTGSKSGALNRSSRNYTSIKFPEILNFPKQLKFILTLTPSHVPPASWTLSSEDSRLLDSAGLNKLRTLPNEDAACFDTLKQTLLKKRYAWLDKHNLPFDITGSKDDRLYLSYGEAIALTNKSDHPNKAKAIAAFIEDEVSRINGTGVALPNALLTSALELRHLHPERCLRILLSLDPTHTLVFEDMISRHEQLPAIGMYPVYPDTDFTAKLEVFDEEIDDEPLAYVQQAYALTTNLGEHRTKALAKARQAEQDAAASHQAAQREASAEVFKAAEASASLSEATQALDEAKTAAINATAAKEKVASATTIAAADEALTEAENAAKAAQVAAGKVTAARKAAENATQPKLNMPTGQLQAAVGKTGNVTIKGEGFAIIGTVLSVDETSFTFQHLLSGRTTSYEISKVHEIIH